MNFQATSLPLALALLGALGAVVWLLYRMKARKPRVPIAAVLLWRRALQGVPPGNARRRWLLSLLLALTIAASLALAALRPELRALGAVHERLAVVVDNSSSMGARMHDGQTRWQHAVAGARMLIDGAAPGSEVMVLDTAGQVPQPGFVTAPRAGALLNALTLSPQAVGHVPAIPASATRTRLFTDGVGIEVPAHGVSVRPVFEPAENIGITAFEGRPVPGHPTRYEVFLRIDNAVPALRDVALEVTGSGGFRIERRLQIGSEPASVTLDVSAYAQGPLRARVHAAGDAFALDDEAYWVVPPHRARRVLLMTEGNEALVDALRALPGVTLSVQAPGPSPISDGHDAYVFDRHAPPTAPAAGALLIAPPAAPWLPLAWRRHGPTRVTRAAQHPLAATVAWPELRLSRAQLTQSHLGAALVEGRSGSAAGALIVSGRARHRFVAVGFDLRDSNFPLLPGFAVFLGQVLDWLTEQPAVASEGLGRIEVPIANAQVRDMQARPVAATATRHGTLFRAPRPGIYVVSAPDAQRIVVANAHDARTVRINDSRLASPGDGAGAVGPTWAWPEPWMLLLGFAFVLLALEWPAFTRRMTE